MLTVVVVETTNTAGVFVPTLPRKLASPLYVAVTGSEVVPREVVVMAATEPTTGTVIGVPFTMKVIVPVGIPVAGGIPVTVAVIVTG
jgi:hypothetical protein